MMPAGQARIVVLGGAFFLLLVAVLWRGAHLAFVEAGSLRVRAGDQHRKKVTLPPQRGVITDRNGKRLAMSVPAASVYVRPREWKGDDAAILALAEILALDPAAVRAAATGERRMAFLKRRVSRREWTAVDRLNLKGIYTELTGRRVYPQGDMAAQVIGIADIDEIGRVGLEEQFNELLQGEAGVVEAEVDAIGRRMLGSSVRRPARRQGARLELTLDAGLQHVAERELAATVEEFGAAGGVIIAMEPQTGEILAMAQLPRNNPNAPTADGSNHWSNVGVSDPFEPGSTMKPFVVAAALERGLTSPSERIYCEGGRYSIGRRTVRDHDPYGWLTVPEVIQFSSNICTAKIGERLGREGLGEALRSFGFGERTGIELPREARGIFTDPRKWGRIHVVTNSFGQGTAVTAIQLTRAYAALANGGHLMRPFLVRRVLDESGRILRDTRPQLDGIPVSRATAQTVNEMMELVVEAGTAKNARIPGVRVAGKTGTAQKVELRTGRYSPTDRISSFVGFAPAEEPRVVIAVIIDRPRKARYGGIVAAPAFRRVGEYALEARGVTVAPPVIEAPRPGADRPPLPSLPPAPPAMAPEAIPVALQSYAGGVPNLLGRGMRDAVVLLDESGYRAQLAGWGVAVDQDPPPGTEALPGTTVRVRFDSTLR